MNQPIHEHLSALMDGELERDETRFLLKRLSSDRDLTLRWARYHVVRQTLRRQDVAFLSANFADRVMRELDAEAVVHARPVTAWLRWGAGGAIAASVAVAALVLTRPADAPGVIGTPAGGAVVAKSMAPQGAPSGATAVASTTPLPGNFRPPLLAPNVPVETAPVSFGSDLSQPIAIDPRLQSYLSRHYQTPGSNGQSALVPYVLLGSPQREGAAQPTTEPVHQNR